MRNPTIATVVFPARNFAASVQAWSTVPIIPERLEEFKRVQTRQLEYKSINDPRISETGPSGNPFLGARKLELGGDKK